MNHFYSYYNEKRYLAMMRDMDADLQTVNMGNRWNKEYFIQQMSNMGCRNGYLGGKPISPTYVKTFHDDTCPHPESNSWMALFDTYQNIRTEMTQNMRGIWVPNINDIMDEIVTNTTWDKRFDRWFDLPISYLTEFGGLRISEIDRNKGQPGTGFTARRRGSRLNLGYRELFSIPRFGEVYCETNGKKSIYTSDILIAIQNGDTPARYYSIMMCKKLPPEIFGEKQR